MTAVTLAPEAKTVVALVIVVSGDIGIVATIMSAVASVVAVRWFGEILNKVRWCFSGSLAKFVSYPPPPPLPVYRCTY